MNLLSAPTRVESPFIIATIGNYTFGAYTRKGNLNQDKQMRVMYPNYMRGITITKTNGILNTYTLGMEYQIAPGDDPNLIDRILGSVQKDRKITLSYGDCQLPTSIYAKEEAIITKVTTNVSFEASKIDYTINCTSTAYGLKSVVFDFPRYSSAKPSDIIKSLLTKKKYGMQSLFTGMANMRKVQQYGLIADDDKKVTIEAKKRINVIDYLNYLVSCMEPLEHSSNNGLIGARYYLLMSEDQMNDLNGNYFKIVKVNSQIKNVDSLTTYEVDVGFPTDNLVTQFSINNDDSWAILYNYADKLDQPEYVYSINNNGEVEVTESPNITTSSKYFETTQAQKSWWTNVTSFPVTATLTLKGLLRPAMLMSYVRINAYFYGKKHTSSGLYIITKQVDSVNANGYKTTLSLTKVGADDDYLSGKNVLEKQQSSTVKAPTRGNITNSSTNTVPKLGIKT